MMRTLKLTGEGDYDKASRMLNETRKEFDKIRVEKMELQNTGLNRRDEVDSSFGFTEVFHDSIKQANRLHSRNCSAIKFHVYN